MNHDYYQLWHRNNRIIALSYAIDDSKVVLRKEEKEEQEEEKEKRKKKHLHRK